ncbi:lysophospholipid acyltransferase family protein [uncultured Desulfobacter sp.]|uniref:lysophospholipid acyltransferase family protein n=1 Tax=uncultured Desulfobacter sp. TaxID=240139 RepID=UPI002AAAC63E|nr:lysophospholipid acyltransferase family protein [uncultured Desulfobacter sp.]
MVKQLKSIIYTRAFGGFLYYFIRLYTATFRFRVENEKTWRVLLNENQPIILVTWHQQFFAAIRHFKTYARYNPGLMISQSRDGELICAVASRSGWHTPRGSSSVGGKEALAEMIEHLNTHGFGGHILDGPTGPMGKVKPGIIKMALQTNAVLVPFFTDADQAWYFNSWDRFMLPKPFARVRLRFFDPIHICGEEKESFEALLQRLEKIMLPGLHR